MSYRQLENIIEEMLLRSFGAFVRRLPTQDRRIFSLYLEGWTADQISRELRNGWTDTQVNAAICRVKKEIKTKYSAASGASAHRVRSTFNS
jgi:hypothetical protein